MTVFDEDTPLELIKAIRPDVLVKGGDYRPTRSSAAPRSRRPAAGWCSSPSSKAIRPRRWSAAPPSGRVTPHTAEPALAPARRSRRFVGADREPLDKRSRLIVRTGSYLTSRPLAPPARGGTRVPRPARKPAAPRTRPRRSSSFRAASDHRNTRTPGSALGPSRRACPPQRLGLHVVRDQPLGAFGDRTFQ